MQVKQCCHKNICLEALKVTGKREEQIILYICVCGTEMHAQVSTVIYHLPSSHFTALESVIQLFIL